MTPGERAAPHAGRRSPRANLRVAGALVAVLLVAATAAPSAVAQGPAFASVDGALYAGPGGTGRTVLLSLHLDGDGGAAGTLLEAPPPAGAAPGLDFAFDGEAVREGDAVVVRARAAPRTTPGRGQDLEIRTPSDPDAGTLDPFGTAEVAVVGADTDLKLAGIGTLLLGGTTLADGSLGVERRAPFFYADPWRTLDVAGAEELAAGPALREGRAQRRDRPRTIAGTWWDRRYATVESLSDDLVSVRVLTDVFAGGAHPDTRRATRLFRRDREDWTDVGPCEALATLGRGCDLAAVRAAVIADLERQEAAWVLDGSVDASAPWLLDLVTLTPRGLRVEFDPYDVGPYVEGPFVVDLPFPLPGE